MSSEPLVSIILVNWNGRALTLDCLRSLRKLSYSRTKILVVDNASTDGSAEAIRAEFPDVLVLPQTNNLRFAGGNNAGMRYALAHGADFVLLLNNDTVVDGEFLSWLVRAAVEVNRVGLVTPKIYYHDSPRRLWYAGGRISMWTGTMRHIGIREEDRGQYDVPGHTGYASGCCILASRAAIETVGLLDESYFMYTEDADWSVRIKRAGFTILYEPRAKIWHKVSVSAGGHLSPFKLRSKYLSNLRFFGRYARWYHWLTFPWMSVVVNAVAGIRYLARKA